MENEAKSVFATLNAINVNEKKEKKNKLDYLSWVWAWAELKKRYPDSTYRVYEDSRGLNYFTDGNTCYVKVGVTVEGLEMVEYLPVMDFRNQSITLDKVTSFDVNKSVQRCLTKAIARHGLGLYIYAGEDLPEDEIPDEPQQPKVSQRIKEVEAILAGTKYNIASAQRSANNNYNTDIDGLTDEQYSELINKLKTL